MRRGAKLRYVAGILGVIARENALKMAYSRVFPAENHRHDTLVEYAHFVSRLHPIAPLLPNTKRVDISQVLTSQRQG